MFPCMTHGSWFLVPVFVIRLYPSLPADLPEELRTFAASLHKVGGENCQQNPKGAQRQATGIVSCFEPLIAERDEVMIRPQREGKEMGDKQVSELMRCIRWCKQMCWGCCRARPPPSHSRQSSAPAPPFKRSSRSLSTNLHCTHQ